MSIRSTAFFVSEAFTALTVNATTDTLTLADFDASITIGDALEISTTLDTLVLVDFDTNIIIGTPLLVTVPNTISLVLISSFTDITFSSVQGQTQLFFSF